MLSILLPLIRATEEYCSLLSDGIVLNKYYLKDCTACKKLTPIFEEIKSRAEKAQINLKFREVECGSCECNGINSFPTLEITKDKQTKSSTVGYKDYQTLTKWINETLSIDKSIFGSHVNHEEGEIKSLSSSDFLTGFDGQWLILFYSDNKDPRRTIFRELSKGFKNKITLGEINSKDAENVVSRYNITEYPFVLAINHGTPVPFTGKMDFMSLSEFAEKLYTPAFQEITYDHLRDITKDFVNGEPVFVVLYKNFEMASFYFNELAQQFKFKAKIYRSSDPGMFAATGHHPKDIQDFEKDPDHNQMVYLTVYKNSSFFVSPNRLDDTHNNIEWIFNTHFPHVTNIENDNFYTVFHGIKPVILLLTRNEDLLEQFNRLSATWHLGTATSNMIFATLDTIEYPLFKQQILKDVKEPAVVFYDPVVARWYHQNTKLTKDNFNNTVMKMTDLYFNKKLPSYPAKKRRLNIYVIGSLVLAVLGIGYKMRSMSIKVD